MWGYHSHKQEVVHAFTWLIHFDNITSFIDEIPHSQLRSYMNIK